MHPTDSEVLFGVMLGSSPASQYTGHLRGEQAVHVMVE